MTNRIEAVDAVVEPILEGEYALDPCIVADILRAAEADEAADEYCDAHELCRVHHSDLEICRDDSDSECRDYRRTIDFLNSEET